MKKIALFAFTSALFLASCTGTCDCDYLVDSYTSTPVDGYVLNSSATIAEDTCLDAGVIDTSYSGGGAFMTVARVECP
ncbi:MAG: hypothetical protein ACO3JZ_04385 [Schleiferiaceae bacterium]|jgi:hypothetical protein|nr:hypothetical protein [Schleiferiaceae bacterium]MDA8820311.1 hypothetical protein [Schleiferiaceae bacterium]PSR06833.1 MAG: hypothetical protein C7N14_07615 [Bacteroidota bacterium]